VRLLYRRRTAARLLSLQPSGTALGQPLQPCQGGRSQPEKRLSAAAAKLASGLKRCRLRDSFEGWAAHSAEAGRVNAMLEAHAGRRRRRQLRVSFLAWADAAREDATAREVLAECQASNAADRRRAAVLAAWREAARRSVYLRTAVTEFRHVFCKATCALFDLHLQPWHSCHPRMHDASIPTGTWKD